MTAPAAEGRSGSLRLSASIKVPIDRLDHMVRLIHILSGAGPKSSMAGTMMGAGDPE